MTKVIFDSSFLIAVAEHHTSWFEDITEDIGKLEPVALECILTELEHLTSRGGKKGRAALVAIELSRGFQRAPCGRARPDEEIISAALTMGAAVATADRELTQSLMARHIKVFGLRSGRVIVL